jgi:hypothetical protein
MQSHFKLNFFFLRMCTTDIFLLKMCTADIPRSGCKSGSGAATMSATIIMPLSSCVQNVAMCHHTALFAKWDKCQGPTESKTKSTVSILVLSAEWHALGTPPPTPPSPRPPSVHGAYAGAVLIVTLRDSELVSSGRCYYTCVKGLVEFRALLS